MHTLDSVGRGGGVQPPAAVSTEMVSDAARNPSSAMTHWIAVATSRGRDASAAKLTVVPISTTKPDQRSM